MTAAPERRRRAIFFCSDGMRHDLMAAYAAAGDMPVVRELIARGASGEDGCLPSLPTNTGAGWATLATGAWSGTSGAINNVFHRTDTPVNLPTNGFDSLLIGAETLAQAAERQGMSAASVEWPGTIPATCNGPVIDFRDFYSARGALCRIDPPAYDAGVAMRLRIADQRSAFPLATGWQHVPASCLPPREASLDIASTRPLENPGRTYAAYVYATTEAGYDRVLIGGNKDGGAAVCDLATGEWAEVRVALSDGRAAGFHVKLIELAPDLSQAWLYFTSTSRRRAHPAELEDLLASPAFPVPETADHGPIEAGLIDRRTYVEQGLMFYQSAERVYGHVIERYQPDLLFAGTPVTDEFSHQFMALVTPAYPGYDPITAQECGEYIRQAYVGADRLLGLLRGLFPPDTLLAVSADHGFGAAWRSINANLVLARAGLLLPDAEGRALPASKAAAYWAGATCNLYVNLAGREPGGVVPETEYDAVCERIITAFAAIDADLPVSAAAPVIDRIFRFEETDAVPTSCGPANMRYAGRTGDVVIFAAPPYQFDAPAPDRILSPSPLFGQHGYLPDTIDARLNVNMRPPLLLCGPGVKAGATVGGARAIDVAPTLAHLLGIEPPAQADGRVLAGALAPNG